MGMAGGTFTQRLISLMDAIVIQYDIKIVYAANCDLELPVLFLGIIFHPSWQISLQLNKNANLCPQHC